MAGINQFQPGKSPLEGIANALEIVNKVYGIKANSQALAAAEEEMKRKQEQEQRVRDGFINQEKLLDYGKDYNISDEASPGALEFKVERGGQAQSKYFTPKSKVEDGNKPLSQAQQAEHIRAGGRFVAPGTKGATTVLAFGVDGKPQQVGLVPPPRASQPGLTVPKPQEKALEALSVKNAGKAAIANQIDATVQILDDPNVSEDQKLVQGRQLIKTLNSQEGADAVGAEEAKRLGSLLEFHVGNFSQPGPFFGRAPISEFSKQAQLTSAGIRNSIRANETQMGTLAKGGSLAGEIPDLGAIAGKTNGKKGGMVPDAMAGGERKVKKVGNTIYIRNPKSGQWEPQ